MRSMKAFMVILVLLFAAGVGAASADQQKTIFYNLTTDEAWAAGMALGQANKALESGYRVTIFLNVRGVLIASKSFSTDSFGGSGMSLQDMLKGAMSKGAQAIICPMCMKKAGLTMDDVIDGVVEGGPDVTMKSMTADDTVVISY
jgi:predicted peroxiredoxin